MDLRAPKLEEYLGTHRSRGVTNYIIDPENKFKDYIYKTELNENIDILPSGDIPPNPSELILEFDANISFIMRS